MPVHSRAAVSALVACLALFVQIAIAGAQPPAAAPAPMDAPAWISLEELAAHDTEDGAWVALNGKVYDVTDWLPEHPGGPGIKAWLGKDLTEMFYSTHGLKHLPNATKELAAMPAVGELEPRVEAAAATGLTLEEVALHNMEEDAWIAIDGKVFDVTHIILSMSHPGGSVIAEWIGRDATKVFTEAHGHHTLPGATRKLATLHVVGGLAPEA